MLEELAFDRNKDLLPCDVSGSLVLRLTPGLQLSTVVETGSLVPGGLAVHRDGRVFIAAMGMARGTSAVLSVLPEDAGMRTIIPQHAGFMPNDFVFDTSGGFYFTDFRGSSTDPKGGAYYVSPDFGTTTSVLPQISMANGVALSTDGRTL